MGPDFKKPKAARSVLEFIASKDGGAGFRAIDQHTPHPEGVDVVGPELVDMARVWEEHGYLEEREVERDGMTFMRYVVTDKGRQFLEEGQAA